MNGRLLLLPLLSLVLLFDSFAAIEGSALCAPSSPSEHVIVYLSGPRISPPIPQVKPVVLDQKNLRFVSHVLPIVRGTTIAFPNSDQIRHNVFSASDTRMFNLGTYPPGVTPTVTFDQSGVVELLCNVHPEMSAYVLVLETPYFSKTDDQGTFRIDGVPPGDYSLSFWCEHQGLISRTLQLERTTCVVEALLHANEVQLDGNVLAPQEDHENFNQKSLTEERP